LATIVILNSNKSQRHQEAAQHNMKAIKNGKKDVEARHKTDMEKQKGNMASVVHDEICPMLTYLLHDMYWIEKISECKTVKTRASQCIDHLTHAMNRCRTVLLDLRPNEDGPNLTESLNCMIGNFKQISGIAVSSDIDPDINQLESSQQSVVYRSVQEALSNSLKHSHAKHVQVTAKIVNRQVQVRVTDDGIGLGCNEQSPAFCIGLKMQKQRAEELSGHFSIQNNPNGMGTEMHLNFPVVSKLEYL
jgi:two-component system sensor histidine kinase UhpB